MSLVHQYRGSRSYTSRHSSCSSCWLRPPVSGVVGEPGPTRWIHCCGRPVRRYDQSPADGKRQRCAGRRDIRAFEWSTQHLRDRPARFLTPPLLGLAGAYLVLVGQAWSLLWVVIVLLFVAHLKTRDWFTTVIVLLLGAGLGWVAVRGDPDLPAGVAVALVWLLLLGAISLLVRTRRSDSGKSTPAPAPASRRRHWTLPRATGTRPRMVRGNSGSVGRRPLAARDLSAAVIRSLSAALSTSRPPRLPLPGRRPRRGGSDGIPCARFVRMERGRPRRVNRAEETS